MTAADSPDCGCEPQDGVPQGLTCIHSPIHCVATQEPGGTTEDVSEVDWIDVDNFINTIAEVALEIARREHQVDDESSGLHQGQ